MFGSNNEALTAKATEFNTEMGENLGIILAHFAKTNTESGVDLEIMKAIGAGKERTRRDIHLFVHHLEPFVEIDTWIKKRLNSSYGPDVGHSVNDYIDSYRDRISQLVSSVDEPIFIESGMKIQPEQTRETTMIPNPSDEYRKCTSICNGNGTSKPTGFLSEDEFIKMLKYTNGIHPDDTMIVHGCFAGACVNNISIQLAGLKMFGQYQTTPAANDRNSAGLTGNQLGAMDDVHDKYEIFIKAQIRMGTVFDLYNTRNIDDMKCMFNQLTNEEWTHLIPEVTN
ncbi:hypothetical protein HOD24_01225 [Candidatus Peregrinibacteria bacterium]|jgi:hypothetical protein|nr:hypothetical protein [Candidatus Peregrinibacteria bacterium]MBT7344719.1 hypothetical protein [Candidatus Peregrinibacteria bacterium]